MVTITGKYTAGLRCVASHGPSGSTLTTDAPVDNHGRGEAFSPTDLLATAMATCMVTTMGIWAERHGVDLGEATFSVVKEMSTTAPRRVSRLTVKIDLPTSPTDEQKQRLEAAARACPVHHSVHPDLATELTITWGAKRPA